jgi:hypothetical protein
MKQFFSYSYALLLSDERIFLDMNIDAALLVSPYIYDPLV